MGNWAWLEISDKNVGYTRNEICPITQATPGWAALLIFILVLFLIGVMEGIQVQSDHLASKLRENHPDRLG